MVSQYSRGQDYLQYFSVMVRSRRLEVVDVPRLLPQGSPLWPQKTPTEQLRYVASVANILKDG